MTTISGRLRIEADALEAGWRPQLATKISDDERPVDVALVPAEPQFRPMVMITQDRKNEDEQIEYRLRLQLPPDINGIPWDSSPLELYMMSSYPAEVRLGKEVLFSDSVPLVAAGPAKLTILEHPCAGDNGELSITVRTGRGVVDGVMAEFVAALHFGTPSVTAAFRKLDLAAARLELGAALASGDVEEELVARVVAVIDGIPGMLVHNLDAVEAALKPLARVLARAQEYEVMCIGHSHIDLSWLWDWNDARAVQRRDLQSVADLMDDYPEFRFTHSQPAAYRAVQQMDPELFARVKSLVAEGRLEPATMQWVEADTNIASGPASARQILEAVRWTRNELGVSPTVHLAPDTFGHAGNLPQLTASGGANIYYHHRGNPGLLAGGEMWPAYWWEGDDGTRLLAVSTPIYLGALTAGRVVTDLIRYGIRPGNHLVCYFFGVGDHGGGPTRDDLDFLRLLGGRADFPVIGCRTMAEYHDAIIGRAGELPVHHGESMTIFEGCYISHSDGKHDNRRGENALVTAEALAAVAGLAREPDLTEAWRTVLFNQFHDIGGGSAIRVVYEDQKDQSASVLNVASILSGRALDILEQGHPGDWVVTNPTSEDRRDAILIPESPRAAWIADEDGNQYPVQATADGQSVFVARFGPFETRGFSWVNDQRTAAPPIEIGDIESTFYDGQKLIVVETAQYLIHVRSDSGVITTLFDKRSRREFVSHGEGLARLAVQARPDLGFGVLQLLDEKPHIMTAWLADEFYREESLIRDADVSIIERGAVRVVIKTTHRVRSSSVTVTLAIYALLDTLEYQVDVDWQEIGTNADGLTTLAIAFGARLGAVEAWYETPYSVAQRPADGRIVPGLRWANVGNDDAGIAVFNDGRYGHDALGPRLRLHLARGSYDPDSLGDLGRESVNLAVLPHTGSWQDAPLTSIATTVNAPLRVRSGTRGSVLASAHVWRPSVVGAAGIHLTEVKRSDAGIILRLVESVGLPGEAKILIPRGWSARHVSIAEDPIKNVDIASDGQLALSLTPHEVQTILLTSPTDFE